MILISHFLFFLFFFITILLYTLILPMSQLQTQQLMTSEIEYIEYFIQTYNILMLILYLKLIRNVAALAVFNTI